MCAARQTMQMLPQSLPDMHLIACQMHMNWACAGWQRAGEGHQDQQRHAQGGVQHQPLPVHARQGVGRHAVPLTCGCRADHGRACQCCCECLPHARCCDLVAWLAAPCVEPILAFPVQVISTLAEDSSGLAEPKHVPYRHAPVYHITACHVYVACNWQTWAASGLGSRAWCNQ